jgi:hypothetical protein
MLDFGGCVTLKGEQEIIGGHAVPVIADPDQAPSAGADFDFDTGCFSIKGIFNQLLNDRGRSLNNLTGGNFIGE